MFLILILNGIFENYRIPDYIISNILNAKNYFDINRMNLFSKKKKIIKYIRKYVHIYNLLLYDNTPSTHQLIRI